MRLTVTRHVPQDNAVALKADKLHSGRPEIHPQFCRSIDLLGKRVGIVRISRSYGEKDADN
jgi:hypothetical protein